MSHRKIRFSYENIWWHLNHKCHWVNLTYTRTVPDLVMRPHVIQRDWETQKRICGGGGNSKCLWMGRQRCVGLFSKTQPVRRHHVTAWQRGGITVSGLGHIRLQWMEKAKIRMLFFVVVVSRDLSPVEATAAAEEGRWVRPAAKITTPSGYTLGLRSSAVSFTLTHAAKRTTVWDILALESQYLNLLNISACLNNWQINREKKKQTDNAELQLIYIKSRCHQYSLS